MHAVRGHEFVIERGEGVWLWDDAGRRYLDASASLWYVNVGHGREEIAAAIQDQAGKLSAYSIFGDYTNEPARLLAARLASLAPLDDARVFLATGGGDAIETAAKLARLYWTRIGEPERVHLIGRRGGFHGAHGFGTAIGGIPVNRAGFGPLVPEVSLVDPDSADALEAEIERLGSDRVAAFFFEPVMGAGGVRPPAPGYLEAAVELCRASGILLVADEIICGFGRLGAWFGVERWGLVPDMMVFAKGVTSGYLPLGGVIASERVAAPFWEQGDPPQAVRHGSTWAGHPLCCVAALANIDIIEREGLLERAAGLESELADALAPLAAHPLVREVRAGTGVLGAVELAPDLLERDPGAVVRLQLLLREGGVLVRPLLDCIAVSPPLVATEEHVATLAAAVEDGLARLA
jgi:adenosylmethionine-8-amino-7-oxononanoate aminotransferase